MIEIFVAKLFLGCLSVGLVIEGAAQLFRIMHPSVRKTAFVRGVFMILLGLGSFKFLVNGSNAGKMPRVEAVPTKTMPSEQSKE